MGDKLNLNDLAAAWERKGLDRRELFRMVGAGAGMAALMTLATTPEPGSAQTSGSQINVEWQKPQTLNPLFSTAGFEQQVERAILGSLVRMSDKLVPTPDLAASVDQSPDATEYTFHLQPNATFSDGTPLTSKDVVFTFSRALDKRTGSIWTARLSNIQGAAEYGAQQADTVSGITAPDDHTVTFKLANPDGAFLVILADFCGLGILPEHVLGQVPPDQLSANPFSLNPNVGAGPYTLAQYQSDQFAELHASPTFWGGKPAVDAIFMRIINPDSAVAELEKGGLDIIGLSVQDVARLQQNPNLSVISIPSPSMDSISCNLDLPYFKDKRVRQAMMYAIDRANIVKEIFQGEAVVRNSPIFGPEWMGVPEGLNEYAYSPDTAKKLLSDAGWDSGQTLQMMYSSAATGTFQQMVPIIQAQLGDVGIKIELQQYDNAGINQHLVTNHDYQMYIGGGGVYGADPNVSSRYYLSNAFTPTGANSVWYANPQVDQLYAQGRQQGDQAQRKATYTQLAKILNDECPSIFLWSPNTIFGVNKRVQGFLPPSYKDNRLWQAEQWSVTA